MADQNSTQDKHAQSQKSGGRDNAVVDSAAPARDAASKDQTSKGTTDAGRTARSTTASDDDNEDDESATMAEGSKKSQSNQAPRPTPVTGNTKK